jgi:hypothetical protein
MPLPTSEATRQLKHRRQIDVQVYGRSDGLWEADARLTDVKTRDARLSMGIRPAGEPIHDMLLRVVVNRSLDIVASGAESLAVPYPGHCDQHGDAYGRLVGLNLLQGFRHALRERVGGVLGCTHISELAQILPTAVVQAMAGEVIDTRGDGSSAEPPFQIDRCHALRSDGPAVEAYYPRWFKPAPDGASPHARPRNSEGPP